MFTVYYSVVEYNIAYMTSSNPTPVIIIVFPQL